MQVATNDTFSPTPVMTPEPTKSATLAERRRIPESTEKLKLYSDPLHLQQALFDHITVLSPSKISEDILLSHLERQQRALSASSSSPSHSIPITSSPVIKAAAANIIEDDASDNDRHMEFWKQLVQDYSSTAQRYPSLLLSLLCQQGGIPASVRGAVWQAMAHSHSTHLVSVYDDLAQQSLSASSPSSSPFMAFIEHDVDTLYGHKYPQHVLDTMKKILKVYILYDPQVEYSTACLSLLIPLLKYVSETQAFCLFVRLMGLYDVRSMFIQKSVNIISVRARLFEILLGQLCPQLQTHLEQNMVKPVHYIGQWYPNLLSSILPDDAIVRLYDLAFALGPMETVTRAGVALMQQAESQLLAMTNDTKSLLLSVCTSKLFDLGYHGSTDAFILDIMERASTVSQEKLATMLDTLTSQMELQNELTRKMEQVAVTPSPADYEIRKQEKRASWFGSWSSASLVTQKQQAPSQLSKQQQQDPSSQPLPATPTSPSSTCFASRQSMNGNSGSNNSDRTVSLLHQQIEDLVTALSQLQKDHSQQSEEIMAIKLKDMESQVERSKLQKRNVTLEKKLKKYKMKISQQQQQLQNTSVLNQQDEHYQSFVRSLRLSGNFGALVAGALENNENPSSTQKSIARQQIKRQSTSTYTQTEEEEVYTRTASTKEKDNANTSDSSDHDEDGHESKVSNNNSNDNAALHAVTSELVAVKLASFEMGQKYENLCHRYNDTEQNLMQAQKLVKLQAMQLEQLTQQLEQSTREKDDFIDEQAALWSEEQEALLRENEDWMDKVMAAKKTASELHLDKLDLLKQVEQLERRVKELETEKMDYLMPRSSFTEEVFATHNVFFGRQQQQRDEVALTEEQQQTLDEFRLKYVETDLRCRELEKLLAEAKVKIADYESNCYSGLSSVASSICCSPRASLQQRASSLQMKRASAASFLTSSSLSGAVQPNGHHQPHQYQSCRVATPTSPTTHSSPSASRLSNESCTSSTNSSTTSAGSVGKRSSMYARICSSISGATGSVVPTSSSNNNIKSPVLYEEPQSIP